MRSESEIRELLREMTAMHKACQIREINALEHGSNPIIGVVAAAEARQDYFIMRMGAEMLEWVLGINKEPIPRSSDLFGLEEKIAKHESLHGKID